MAEATNEVTFDPQKINEAIALAQEHHKSLTGNALNSTLDLSGGGEMSLTAQCVSVSVQNGKICLNLPFGIGHVCLPIPKIIPNGTAAQACLSICTTWGIPTGVKVTISALGHVVLTKSFGKC